MVDMETLTSKARHLGNKAATTNLDLRWDTINNSQDLDLFLPDRAPIPLSRLPTAKLPMGSKATRPKDTTKMIAEGNLALWKVY